MRTSELADAGLALVRDGGGLALVDERGTELRGDLSRMVPRLRRANLARELLVRAARVRGARAPTAVDATAGLGEDALLLAAAGFSVTLFERDEVVAALLEDALARAARDPALAEAASRMRLVRGDSVRGMAGLTEAPDVVLLDPMFPARHKDAATTKKLQLIQRLERPCEDEPALLRAALLARPRKVVVKRPAKGPWLAGVRPNGSVAGKTVRYDVIVPASVPAAVLESLAAQG